MAPCMFSSRASRPLSPRTMNGAGSLNQGVVGATPASAVDEEGVIPTASGAPMPPHAASTAAAPPAAIRPRNRRRFIPRALAYSQSERAPVGGSHGFVLGVRHFPTALAAWARRWRRLRPSSSPSLRRRAREARFLPNSTWPMKPPARDEGKFEPHIMRRGVKASMTRRNKSFSSADRSA